MTQDHFPSGLAPGRHASIYIYTEGKTSNRLGSFQKCIQNYRSCKILFNMTSIYIYIYIGEIKMYFYLAMVGFEPTPTATAAPSNTETTVIPSRPLRSLKKKLS